MFNAEDLGKYYRDENGVIYKLIGYCAEPSVTLERVGNESARIGGGINGLMFQGFQELTQAESTTVDQVSRQVTMFLIQKL